MKAINTMIKQGYWLFRYRSYLPILLLVFVLGSLWLNRQLFTTESTLFDLSCLIVALCGEFIRIVAIGYAADRTSGRNTKQQTAMEINKTGIYSLMRHPLYVGNFFMWLGIALYTRLWWIVLVFILIYWLYYERIIIAEEDFLEGKFGDEFLQYTEIAPAIFPDFRNYIPNKIGFRLKKVLRQENSSLFGLVCVFALLEIFQDAVSNHKIDFELYWQIIGFVSLLTYITLRILKKYTRILYNTKKQEKNPIEE